MELKLQHTRTIDTPMKFEIIFYRHNNKDRFNVNKIPNNQIGENHLKRLTKDEVIDLIETLRLLVDNMEI